MQLRVIARLPMLMRIIADDFVIGLLWIPADCNPPGTTLRYRTMGWRISIFQKNNKYLEIGYVTHVTNVTSMCKSLYICSQVPRKVHIYVVK